MMKFAHFSDCHIGGWREEKLRALSLQSFQVAVDLCLREGVEFVVISGDLFNTSVPSIDAMKVVAGGMRKLQHHGVRVYVIPGSHDYSPSGKTMLDVLERSGLCVNVFKFNREEGTLSFVVDEKTNTHIAGMVGLKGGLEKFDYMKLKKKNLEEPHDGLKVFLFHSLLTEFKPVDFEMVDSEPLMSLPKHFHYYAGGHPHFVFQRDMGAHGYGLMTYPGPLFPNNFRELERLQHGGFYVVDVGNAFRCTAKHIPVALKEIVSFTFSADGKSADDVGKEIESALHHGVSDAIVTVRVEGCLRAGKASDIPFKKIFDSCEASLVLKNTHKLTTQELAEVVVEKGSVHDVEERLLLSHAEQFPVHFLGHRDGVALARALMQLLDKEKLDGERLSDFEDRILSDVVKELRLEALLHED